MKPSDILDREIYKSDTLNQVFKSHMRKDSLGHQPEKYANHSILLMINRFSDVLMINWSIERLTCRIKNC